MIDSDPVGLSTWLAVRPNDFHLAYLYVMRSDLLQRQIGGVMTPVRAHYQGVFVGNMNYTVKEAKIAIADGSRCHCFRSPLFVNPDLSTWIKAGVPLNPPQPTTFYTPGSEGYTDYPVSNAP